MTTFLLELIVRTTLVAAAVGAVLFVMRIRRASIRHAAWTSVVLTMLLLPTSMAAGLRMALPVLTPSTAHVSVAANVPVEPIAPSEPPQAVVESSAPPVTPATPVSRATAPIDWWMFLAAAYVTGALILLVRLGIGTVQAHRLRRHATAHDGRLTSDRCSTPITVGWLKPALILPRGWDRWSSDQLAVVLTHEHQHARRRDPLTQWLALLNRAVFWFHPLAWWLERRLATLAEEACDAVVIAAGHSPQDYSEYLLDMARAVSRQRGRVRLVGMAMPGTGLPDRLRLIFLGLPDVRVSRARLISTAAFCIASSALFAAGTLAPRAQTVSSTTPASSIKFDVVSIKPCPGLPPRGVGRSASPSGAQVSPGHVRWECVTMSQLIDQAYAGSDSPLLNMLSRAEADSPRRVRGGPSWVDSDLFTIEANVTGDAVKPELTDSARFMYLRAAITPAVRAMLEDRFQLKLRRATEEQSMYALTVSKAGLDKDKVRRITAGVDCWVWDPATNRTAAPVGSERLPMCENMHGGLSLERQARQRAGEDFAAIAATSPNLQRLEFTGFTMPGFAQQLSSVMDHFVLDKTGLDGAFNLAFEYEPDDHTPGRRPNAPAGAGTRQGKNTLGDLSAPRTSGGGPTIFKALETIGLKLEPTKGSAEYLVIDSVQQPKPNAPAVATIDSPSRAQGAGPFVPDTISQVAAKSEKFDVVSIKPCPDVSVAQTGRGAGPNLAQTSAGHVFWACVTLASLVDQAYAGWDFPLLNDRSEPIALAGDFDFVPGRAPSPIRIESDARVRGGPSWMYSERFTIEATASADVINPPAGAVNLMRLPAPMNRALRAMLEDRFQLKLRRETEERPMYALTVAKDGLKAKPRAAGDCEVPPDVRPPGTKGRPTADGFFEGKWFCSTFSTAPLAMQARLWAGETIEAVRSTSELNRRYEYRGVTLQKVADQLAHAMDRFVIDKTGVAGEFLLAVEFKSDDTTPDGGFFLTTARNETAGVRRPETPTGHGSTIFKAFEALGLKIEPTKGPAEYLLIESAQRPKPDKPRP